MVISHLDMSIADVNSEFFGVNRLLLMENAGTHVARVVQGLIDDKKSSVLICCGTGGNGGDGFVAARHLARFVPVKIMLLGQPSRIRSKEALYNWKVLDRLQMSLEKYTITDSRELPDHLFDPSMVIVDALLGTGIHGKVKEPVSSCIDMINLTRKRGAVVVSVDVPSGLGESGKVDDKSVIPDYNVSLHASKTGTDSFNCKNVVANIGIPPEAEVIVGPGDLIPLRSKQDWAHKGDAGRVLIIGGSTHYSGAPALSALATLRTGTDLVTVMTPASVSSVIRSVSPSIIVRPYPSDFLSIEEVSIVEELVEKSDVVLIGPGLSTEGETGLAVQNILDLPAIKDKKIVIDADGLKLIKPDLLTDKTVLTPHGGEFKLLTGVDLPPESENISERIKKIQEVASSTPATFLVKGHHDVICNGIRWKVNITGDTWMTIGGTGDVLAGITASLCYTIPDTFRAAVAGAYICGLAGMIVKHLGKPEMPETLIDYIDSAINESRKFMKGERSLLKEIYKL
ncbi:MAG: NAD(P)H-hydrate dehydratase [Candidatus Hodarchaeales archaeon]|jgi:NAD(P)H-hydrate epimerase